MKRWMMIILAAVLMFTMCGCQNEEKLPDFDAVQESGVLRIGITTCPPFCQTTDGQWTGFDIALAEAVAEELGVRAQFVETDWSGRWTALSAGEVDCIWGCVTATDYLVDQVDLSQTYLASRPVLVTTRTNAEETNLTGMKIAAERDSACALAAEACLGSVTLVQTASQTEALDMVRSGEADAAVVDQIVAGAVATEERLVIREDLELGVHELTVALRLNSDLTDKINQALTKLQSQGFLDELAESYGIQEYLVVG